MGDKLAKTEKRNVKIVPRRQLIKEVADKLNLYIQDVDEIYSEIESAIVEHLMEADEEKDVEINFSEGCKFKASFLPAHYHEHPFTKEPVFVQNKLKFGFSYSKNFKEKRTAEYRESRRLLDEYLEERRLRKEKNVD